MRKLLGLALIVQALIILSCPAANAEDTLRLRVGIFGHYQFNNHTSDFRALPGVPNCCPRFEKATGNGISAGAFVEIPITKWLLAGLRLGYYDYSAEFTYDEQTTIMRETPTVGTIRHRIDTKITQFGFEPTLIVKPYKNFVFNIGANFGTFLFKKDFNQDEKIVGYGTFLDNQGNDTYSSTRNDTSGIIPKIINPPFFSLVFGIGYELPLNRSNTLILCPELSYSFGLSNVISGYDWKINALRAGVALKFSPRFDESEPTEIVEEEKPVPPQPKVVEVKVDTIEKPTEGITTPFVTKGTNFRNKSNASEDGGIADNTPNARVDTIHVPIKENLTASITAVGLDSLLSEIENPIYKIEEFAASELRPLLPYIFFDENSATIHNRYVQRNSQSITGFNEDKLFRKNTLGTYYEILNIVGARLRANPDARITITGTNDGFSSEKENTELAMNRANTVADYLRKVWGIEEKRITVEKTGLPGSPSTPIGEAEKTQENRRVELYSDNYEILKPVFVTDTTRSANPPRARFKFATESTAGIKELFIRIFQNNEQVKQLLVDDPMMGRQDWDMVADQEGIPKLDMPIEYSLLAIDQAGKRIETPRKTIGVELLSIKKKRENRIDDVKKDKYGLILFDFDSDKITGRNSEIVKFIKTRVEKKSMINITGYTDRSGADKHNLDLSDKRAKNTKNALGYRNADAIGVGERQPYLYTNELPEGRFYCRTVEISITTPVK